MATAAPLVLVLVRRRMIMITTVVAASPSPMVTTAATPVTGIMHPPSLTIVVILLIGVALPASVVATATAVEVSRISTASVIYEETAATATPTIVVSICPRAPPSIFKHSAVAAAAAAPISINDRRRSSPLV